MSEIKLLKVGAKTVPNKTASSIVHSIKEGFTVEIQAVGAGAVNQTNKAVAIANDFAKEEMRIAIIPKFNDITIDDKERTALRFEVIVLPL